MSLQNCQNPNPCKGLQGLQLQSPGIAPLPWESQGDAEQIWAQGCEYNMAFRALLMMVLVVFANEKPQGNGGIEIFPLTDFIWRKTRWVAGVGVVTRELVRMAFPQGQAGCGLRPRVCDGTLAAGTTRTKGILDVTPRCAAKSKGYVGQSESCFVGKPVNRLGAAARQDLLEEDGASHHLPSATSFHPV